MKWASIAGGDSSAEAMETLSHAAQVLAFTGVLQPASSDSQWAHSLIQVCANLRYMSSAFFPGPILFPYWAKKTQSGAWRAVVLLFAALESSTGEDAWELRRW